MLCMTVGEKIRQYRKQMALTQAQLAEAVGVSVQAVSKWETGGGMPDVAQIVPLARALRVTTDQLLDFSDRLEEFERQWKETLRTCGDDSKRLLEVSKAALEEFPRHKTFLFRAAVDHERLAQLAEDDVSARRHLDCALMYADRFRREDPEDETGKGLLVTIYSKLGRDEEAVALAYTCKNRDTLLKCWLKGEALRRHHQKLIDRKLHGLLHEMLIDDDEILEAAERILRAAIPDGNLRYHEDTLAAILGKRASLCAARGDEDGAAVMLSRLFELAKAAHRTDGAPMSVTAPLFDLLTYQRPADFPPPMESWFLSLVEYRLPHLKARPDIAEMMAEARLLLAK